MGRPSQVPGFTRQTKSVLLQVEAETYSRRLQWFDRQKAYLDSLESQLRSLVKAIDLVAKQRSELAIARGEFAVAIGDLASCDVEKQLASSLSALADVERKAQDLSSKQSEQDVVTLMSTGMASRHGLCTLCGG